MKPPPRFDLFRFIDLILLLASLGVIFYYSWKR